MSKLMAYGIDFGTTNSSLAAVVDGRPVVLQAEPKTDPPEALRSLVFLHRDGDRDAGFEAARKHLITAPQRHRCRAGCDRVEVLPNGAYSDCRQFDNRLGGCQDSRLISGLKPLLTDERFRETSSWAEVFHLEDLVGIVMRQLKRRADDTFGVDARSAVIGFPVHFQTSDAGAVAFSRLRRAAEQSGFEDVEFCPEPVAAVSGESKALAGKTVCSVDFGGGTFDVVILRFDPSGDGNSDLLGIDGAPVGGELFDGKLFDHVVAPLLRLDAEFEGRSGDPVLIPNQVRSLLRSLANVVWMAADPGYYFILRQLQAELLQPEDLAPVMDIIYGGQAFDFFAAIEGAKKELSTSDKAWLTFRRGAIDIEAQLSRSQFERLIRPELDQVRGSIESALEMAGLAPREVDLVLRTGGSALLPAFNEMLDQIFGAVRVESRPAFTSVASGLAEIAARSVQLGAA